ncbi:MAG: Mpo1-like protein [Lutibacter sp.]
MEQKFESFEAFYPFYLSQHKNKTCRLLHMIGTTVVLALFITGILYLNIFIFLLIPIAGYGFAWVGHFFFEKNQPATFTYPWWSLKSDFKMYFDILTDKLSLDSSQDPK